MSAGQDELTAVSPERGRTRRSWSREEKRRIIAEAFRPGASAADVARGYGLNANQLFNWRRALAVPAKNRGSRIMLVTVKRSTPWVQGSDEGLVVHIASLGFGAEAAAAAGDQPPKMGNR